MADTKISDLTAVTSLSGTEMFVLATDVGTTRKITASDLSTEFGGSVSGVFDAYAMLRDERSAGTDGGTFTSGAWQTRTLQTTSFDDSGITSLSSNQFTLQAGSYFIDAWAMAGVVNDHKAKLRNITDSTDDIVGSSEDCRTAGTYTRSTVRGRITIASAKTFELQHRCATTKSTDGFGAQTPFSVVEVFAEVLISREA